MTLLSKNFDFRPYIGNHAISFGCLVPAYGHWQCHPCRPRKAHRKNMSELKIRIGVLHKHKLLMTMSSKAIANDANNKNNGSNSWEWEDADIYDSEEEANGDNRIDGLSQGLSSGGVIMDGGNRKLNEETEQLRREVELMLNPKEKIILQRNEPPDFSKLASPKWIPLHTLATSGQILLVDDVLKQGFDVNSIDKYGLTVLQKVVLCKKEAMFSRLLKRGADPHVRDKDGATLLHYAVLVGAVQTVKLLIKYNVDVNCRDNEGWTPLHLAVQSRMRNVAKILLLNGADKTLKNKDGNTPFDVAISLGKGFKTYEITKLLKLVPAAGV